MIIRPEVKAQCRLLPARLRNHAGIVGAAAFAAERGVLAMQGKTAAELLDDDSAISTPILASGTGDA